MEKTILKKLAMLLACLPLTMMADGYKYFVHDGIQYATTKDWHTDSKGNKYRIALVAPFRKDDVFYKGDLVIPSSFVNGGKEYRVEGFIDHAFWGSNDLTSLTLPASIESVGHVFGTHRKLEKIIVEDLPNKLYLKEDDISERFEGIFVKNCSRYVSEYGMLFLKGPVVKAEIDTRFQNRGRDLSRYHFLHSEIDTLHLKCKGKVVIAGTSNPAYGKVKTLVIDEITEQKSSGYHINTMAVYQLNVEHLVLGPGVTKIYDDMVTAPIKSITVQGTVKSVSNKAFPDLSSLQTYDVGDNQNVTAMLEYRLGAEFEKKGEKEKAMTHLRKASELGSAAGTALLAKYQGNAADWEKTMSKSAQQGSGIANATLQAMEYCKRLREIYPSIAALAKAGKMDTTLMKEVRMMSEYNGISLNNQDHRKTNNTMKYSIPGYEDVYNKARDMLAYFFMCQELTRKYRDHYYAKKVSGSRYLYYLGEEYSTDRSAIANAHHFASRYSTIASQDFRPFFVNAAKQLTAKKEKFDAQNKEELLIVEQHNNEVDQLKREEALEHKRQTDPDYMPVPAITGSKKDDTHDCVIYYFADESSVRVYKGTIPAVFLKGEEVYYHYEGYKDRKYNWPENAAKAGWIWKKHRKIRTIGLEKN